MNNADIASAEHRFNTKQLDQLELAIRHASSPDNPNVLYDYLNQLEANAAFAPPSRQQVIHQHVFDLLIETISDSLLPWHWRVTCLDQMYRPLTLLEKLATSPQMRRDQAKRQASFTLISRFFLQTFPID